MRKTSGVLFLLLALVMLVPGIVMPVLSMTGTVDKQAMVDIGMNTMVNDPNIPDLVVSLTGQVVSQLDLSGEIQAYSKTRSIAGTIQELAEAEQWLVAFLIALFSIIVPLTKIVLMLVSALLSAQFASLADRIVRTISKWSMADVFVVAVIVAYLAANSTEQTEELFTLNAQFGEGFYYFLGYCLLSILSTQLLDRIPRGAGL